MSDGPNGCTCGHNGDCNCPFVPSPGEADLDDGDRISTFLDHPPDPSEPKKRRKGTSPTARTLAELRKRGWTAQVVERPWNKYSKVTQDLFGCIDIIAIVPAWDVAPQRGHTLATHGAILAIQATGHVTGGGNHAARRAKIIAEPRAAEWVAAGGRLELWSWSKQGAAGKAKRWTLRVETYAEMLSGREAP